MFEAAVTAAAVASDERNQIQNQLPSYLEHERSYNKQNDKIEPKYQAIKLKHEEDHHKMTLTFELNTEECTHLVDTKMNLWVKILLLVRQRDCLASSAIRANIMVDQQRQTHAINLICVSKQVVERLREVGAARKVGK